MKMLKIILPALALALIAMPADARKKVTKKTAKKETVKVDTVPLAQFSYAMGVAQTEGLMPYLAQRMGIDTTEVGMTEFLRGFIEARDKKDDPKLSAYSAGIQIAKQIYGQMVPNINKEITGNDKAEGMDMESFNKGILDAIKGNPTISGDSARNVSNRQMQFYIDRVTEQKYGKNRIEGEAFLKANAKNDSVKTLPSGVQYKVLKAGTGEIPTATQRVKVHYEGKLLDGTVFDSSYKRGKPATFGCNQVIKGWTDALTHMPVGSTWEVYIPQDLAYGSRNMGNIPPLSTLIFKIELQEIVK